MIGTGTCKRFMADESGAAAEFALMLPIIMLFLVGIVDAGRFAYEFNRGEKASQIGARVAVVTSPLVKELETYTFVGKTVGTQTVTQGDRIPIGALGTIKCTATACTCETTPCLDGTLTINTVAFGVLAARVKQIWPAVADADITVEYTGSGLGYAGNPSGMDVAPFVTVRLAGKKFKSILLFGSEVNLPDFGYTLTMEDGAGDKFN